MGGAGSDQEINGSELIMPMIINGEYHKHVDMSQLKSRQNSTWKRADHKRQRQDFASEVVQPYARDGKPSEAFIDNYPNEAIDYGFVKSEAQILGDNSGTEVVDQGAVEVYADDIKLEGLIPEEEMYG